MEGQWSRMPAGAGYTSVSIESQRDTCTIEFSLKAHDTADVTDVDGDPIIKTTHLAVGVLGLSKRQTIALGRQLIALAESLT